MVGLRDQLVGTATRSSVRGPRHPAAFAAAERELRRLKFVPNSWWRLEPVFQAKADAQRARTGREFRSPRVSQTSLGFAVSNGYPASHEELDRFMESRLPGTAAHGPADWEGRSWARLEGCASIDIKTMQSLEWLVSFQITGWHLRWPAELTGDLDVTIFADCSEEGAWTLHCVLGSARGAAVQVIQLVQRAEMSGRWFMRCPILGTDHAQLYLRDGVFASSKAQRLRYSSQLPNSAL